MRRKTPGCVLDRTRRALELGSSGLAASPRGPFDLRGSSRIERGPTTRSRPEGQLSRRLGRQFLLSKDRRGAPNFGASVAFDPDQPAPMLQRLPKKRRPFPPEDARQVPAMRFLPPDHKPPKTQQRPQKLPEPALRRARQDRRCRTRPWRFASFEFAVRSLGLKESLGPCGCVLS